MNKPELTAAVAALAGVSKTSAGEVINIILDEVTLALVRGERVALPGLGTFTPKNRSARSGINPRSGESIDIAASRSVGFKPGKSLKDAVAG